MPDTRGVDDPPAVTLVWPAGEEGERAMRDALHSRGDERTPAEEGQYRELVAKHGDPDLTIETYSEFLKLHAQDDERTTEETTRYRAIGDRFALHGRPELRQFHQHTASGRVSCRPAPRRQGRTPRSRRIRTSRSSHGPPGRKSADEDPLDPPARVIYAHAARVRDPRVARWLEAWGDESLEGAA